jgi:uncharacterized protein (TIGR02246 family)
MTDNDIRAIRQVLARFVDAWNARNADAFANLYTDPRVDVNHTPSVETRAATVAALRKRFEHLAARLSVSSDEVLVFGAWAVAARRHHNFFQWSYGAPQVYRGTAA